MKTNKFKLIELLVCFSAASIIMVSCNKVDGEKIVGTWGCIHSYNHSWSINDEYGITYDDHEYTDTYRGEVVNIKEDGTYTTANYEYVGPFYKNGGSWMIDDDNNLIIDGKSCVIQTLNNTTLKLNYYKKVIYDSYIDTMEGTIEFKRQ